MASFFLTIANVMVASASFPLTVYRDTAFPVPSWYLAMTRATPLFFTAGMMNGWFILMSIARTFAVKNPLSNRCSLEAMPASLIRSSISRAITSLLYLFPVGWTTTVNPAVHTQVHLDCSYSV